MADDLADDARLARLSELEERSRQQAGPSAENMASLEALTKEEWGDEDAASSDDEDAKREWAELCASVSKPVGSPLRFAVGDRVECKLEDGYASATVVRVWYECKMEDGDPYDKAVPYQCRLDDGSLVFAPMDNDMCVRAPTDPRARSEAILLRAAAAAKAGDMDEAKRLMQLATDELAAARATAPPAVRVNAPAGIGEPRMGPLGPLGVPRLSQTARDAIARLERGEPDEGAEEGGPWGGFRRPDGTRARFGPNDGTLARFGPAGGLDVPTGAPLRFAIGDRVECRCGGDYVPATVVDIWVVSTIEGFGDCGPMDCPYQCVLDTGETVYAPADMDMCVRASTEPAPAPAPPRDHIIRKNEGVSKEVMEAFCSTSCECSSENCNCSQGPMAMWRSKDGQDQFMGIVRYSSLDIMPDETSVAGSGNQFTFVKLDDPHGELDGPGHVMDDNEFLSDVSLYDGCRPVGPKVEFTSMRAKDQSVLKMPFETGGNKFSDVPFPFDVNANGDIRARVRAGDSVKVLREQQLPAEDAMRLAGRDPSRRPPGMPDIVRCSERQWLRVVAVETYGLVVAFPMPGGPTGDMDAFKWSPEIKRGKAVVFSADCILTMKKKQNW